MRSSCRSFIHVIKNHFTGQKTVHFNQSKGYLADCGSRLVALEPKPTTCTNGIAGSLLLQSSAFMKTMFLPSAPFRSFSTVTNTEESITGGSSILQDSSSATVGTSPRIKFKRLDKTARHIMQILDREAVQEVKAQREIPDIQPGYIIQLKVEVPENKRRVSVLKGIVIARRNAGLNSTFRLRRLVAGVGVESVFPLYSPNIKDVKVLEKKRVRRAKLYYLRDRMNPLKK